MSLRQNTVFFFITLIDEQVQAGSTSTQIETEVEEYLSAPCLPDDANPIAFGLIIFLLLNFHPHLSTSQFLLSGYLFVFQSVYSFLFTEQVKNKHYMRIIYT